MAQTKQPKVPKLARPKTTELRVAYRNILSADINLRVHGLTLALQWYDAALHYVIQKRKGLSPKAKKLHELATKTRRLAISSDMPGEKEVAIRKTIDLYEKVIGGTLKLPKVDAAYTKYDGMADKLLQKQDRLTGKYSNIMTLLAMATKPLNAEGKPVSMVVVDQQKIRQYDPMLLKLMYSREAAKAMKRKLRYEGLLPLVIQELPILSQAGALCRNAADGTWGYDPSLQMQAYKKIMENFAEFSRTDASPRKLVRMGKAPTTKARKVRTPGAKRGPIPRGPKVGGVYVGGTAMGILYNELKDGSWHEKNVLQGKISAELPGRLRRLKKDAGKYSKWDYEEQGTKVRLKMRR